MKDRLKMELLMDMAVRNGQMAPTMKAISIIIKRRGLEFIRFPIECNTKEIGKTIK